jgi:hypothetical protein
VVVLKLSKAALVRNGTMQGLTFVRATCGSAVTGLEEPTWGWSEDDLRLSSADRSEDEQYQKKI